MREKKSVSIEFFDDILPGLSRTDVFGVFERQMNDRQQVPYFRRNLYKVSVVSGKGILRYSDRVVNIDSPALLFLNPLMPYAWEPKSAEQKGYYCLFDEEFLAYPSHTPLLKGCSIFSMVADPAYFLDDTQLAYINSIFSNMVREFRSGYHRKLDLMHTYLDLIFHEAMKIKPTIEYMNNNASERLVSLFFELMNQQFPVKNPNSHFKLRTAINYAEHLGIHVNHLNRALKEITGKTTTEHLNQRLILEAKILLQSTNWTINEIAFSLGYDYPTYFTNFFKKQTGITPNALRQSA